MCSSALHLRAPRGLTASSAQRVACPTLPPCLRLAPAGSVGRHGSAGVSCRARSKDQLRQSFDSEDELDKELATELNAVVDPDRLQKLAKHFELAWKINRPGRPQTCDCCQGRKEEECNWCHGTGYLMVGEQMFPSTPTHTNNCPVCKGKGYCKCERCRGTGFRANWLPTVENKLMP
ncbi:hypothetical protein HYH03_001165 [Edaphochlamys debaryana]|uniref:Uncharacterized protein n=1 Tax=Edaphochlamys debaryana TaxID=47281 RepID=A0A835YEF8_9CHLO|nr:hypothetical protein HYH03_001165 [Edaphochlamys debaryana]|eukprot:KAG2501377.1 hypothetical protein HYH03_001165 [Edaphochlamys debaryana]